MRKERRSVQIEEEADEGESWLLSYSDMMTLVACFFILMMAFANYDPKGFQEKSEVIAGHFSKVKISETKMKEMQSEIARHPELKEMTKITVHDSSMTISLSGTLLFPNNETDLTPEVSAQLDTLIDIIKTFDSNYRIVIEGHSDNLPIQRGLHYKDHWSQAALRASAVAERFQYFGFLPHNIKVVSLGETEPLKPNQDQNGKPIEENLALNRRVVIKVIENKMKTEGVRLGLGHYFNN